MSTKLPPLRSVQVFEVVARLLSFTLAAQELCISQSAVSHQIRLLEDFVGESLFLRQGRQVQLSPAGENYYQEVSQCLSGLAHATAQLIGQEQKSLRLALYSYLAVKWLVPRLPQFRAQHPEIDLELIMVADEEPLLSDKVADLFITSYPNKKGYVSKHLHSEQLIPVCSPKLYAQLDRQGLPASLWDFPLLETEDREWQTWSRAMGVSVPEDCVIHRFSHTILAYEAAAYDQGIALLTDILVKEDLDKGRLVPLELPPQPAGYELYLCGKYQRSREPAFMALVKWLQECLPQ